MNPFRPSVAWLAQAMVLAWVGLPVGLSAQETTAAAVESLEFAELEFRHSEAERYRVEPGVEVFFFENHSLPLVSVFARFRGGPSYFSREEHGATTAVPMLLRSGAPSIFPLIRSTKSSSSTLPKPLSEGEGHPRSVHLML